MTKSDSQNTEVWKDINWRKAQKYVFKLQKRIYAASRQGDVKRCRRLQKLLMRSWYNKVLAALAAKLAGVKLRQSLQAEGSHKRIREKRRQEWMALNCYPQKHV